MDRSTRPDHGNLVSPEESTPPPYSLYASADVHANGRVDVDLDSRFARTLARVIELQQEDIQNPPPNYAEERAIQETPVPEAPGEWDIHLNIVIQIVGSRGDVQPFIALGNELQKYGHRVRLATHNVFEEFVSQSGLEFFPIGGDPTELMAFMVKNPGLIPQMKSLRAGEVQKKRAMVAEMLDGCWKSCIEDDPATNVPFVADAIIANPPSFAHIHCAQALSIPVHLMFTMPWTSTRAFPHPLANLRSSTMNIRTANWVSYGVVEWLTWQGLGDVINRWRASIDLEAIPTTEGPSLAETLKVPFTYCWSPALVPKPRDWPAHIDICGFFFREPPAYEPPPGLHCFLESGPPPIYIGFGSIVIDNPQRLTNILEEAVARAGVRAIISRGWSRLGRDSSAEIHYIDECPHEWLFQRVAAVVHHGGAGTTACGLANGKATTVVPFFGDQQFWGNMIAGAGAGPLPIPHASLNAQNLAEAILFCLTPEATRSAHDIAFKMQYETGVSAAVHSFHRHLPSHRMRCPLIQSQPAVWKYKKSGHSLNLSRTAVQILINNDKLDAKNLRCHDINPIYIQNRRWDPITGVLSASTSTGSSMLKATGEMIYKPYQEYRRGRTPQPAGESSRDSLPLLPSPASTVSDSSNRLGTAGNMAGASLKGFGKVTGAYFKGVVVDIPHAAAEGFRQIPRLYGEEPKNYGTVRDWKSGAAMGGRNFVDGMTDGLAGFFTKPIKGAREEGAMGAVKGFAKGTLGLATKLPSAGIGLVAYPFHGITNTIESAVRSKTRKAVVNARLREGYQMTRRIRLTDEEERDLLQRFDVLMHRLDV
ncbi:sterol glucosyltransferase [Aspergillus heteromorphus CBS 117.55]|uniref:Sterol glucosyltransferase n=1 Tax=Aspergillus heteromorphus CBS 117.55 TaxID=1448321 RepID=A0A317V2A5_9EURO|nr:sterol glucosyltransferase [Aspergillus heteromorphus CBS 117.55]PWY68434.1 sterol glucosyltransferase [Aspergillus heteromorphus CBS 117.55]